MQGATTVHDPRGCHSYVAEFLNPKRPPSAPVCDGVDDDDQLSSSHHILLDVRSAHQYAICSLSGSRNIPLFDLPASMEQLKEMEKQEGTRELFVICRRGIASVKATKLLLEFGLSNVKNVTGGLDAWHAEVDPTLPMY